MNNQNGSGIEWTDFTWNPIGGCRHACKWNMPDGSVAVCYAKNVAEGVASVSYPEGFEAHYWHPERLDEPLKLKEPSRIFLDSMSDIMGAWVPDEQIHAVLDVVRRAQWHTFQLLTKNAPRLLKFRDKFPPNLWVGVSMPPSQMFGKTLTEAQQERMFRRSLDVLADMPYVTWVSFEPLSFDVAGLVNEAYCPICWAVIGAASQGRTYYQPDPAHVRHLLAVLDWDKTPVFFKGNLTWEPRRAEFPECAGPV